MMSLWEIISFSDSCIFTGRSLLYPQITGSHLPRHSLRWTYDRVKALAKTWQRTLMIPISYSKPRSVFLLLLWSFLICDYVQVFLKGKKWWIWGKESRKNVYPSMNCVLGGTCWQHTEENGQAEGREERVDTGTGRDRNIGARGTELW